jgi:hypothetical protein
VSINLGCNLGAARAQPNRALIGIRHLVVCACFVGCGIGAGLAQDASAPAVSSDEPAAAAIGKFLGGAAVALALHESGHLLLDVAFDADPRIKKVSFGPFPFFAIAHRPLSPAHEFAVSSAGFWMQHATSELLLTRRPRLRSQRAPFAKGILAFNVLASVAYAGAAFARAGPPERDTRGMAASARVDEPVIGVLILAPAALDTARYLNPDSRWFRWTSRAAKIAGAMLIFRARAREG